MSAAPAPLSKRPIDIAFWYRATIWIDSLVFGPFYVFAMWAFWKGKNWIRVPSFVWAGRRMYAAEPFAPRRTGSS